MLFFLFTFASLGLIFGSFSTVLIERWHSGRWGIMMWRSECPHCRHILNWRDLFPLFSYMYHRGKCAYCHAHIPLLYPSAELLMWSIFMILGYVGILIGIDPMSSTMILLLFFGFVTGVYILYDIRYMEIPDQILIPAIYILLLIPFISILFSGYSEYTFHTFHIRITDRLMWAWLLYTFFYLQILIPGGYYLMSRWDWKHVWELLMGYVTFPIMILIAPWKKNVEEEDTLDIPTWIGGGDLRVAIFIGLTMGVVHGIMSFAFAYIIGSIVWICILLYNRLLHKKTHSQIPFWPFLWLGWIMSIIFYQEIIIFYTLFFIGQ